jgi:hypothetical protein
MGSAVDLLSSSCSAEDIDAAMSTEPVCSDGSLGRDFRWGFFTAFAAGAVLALFWEALWSRLRRAGRLEGLVLASVAAEVVFFERPSFGDLALVVGT